MKKILFSFMLLLLTAFSVGMVNAEEVTTEEEIVRTYEEEIVLESEDGQYSLSNEWGKVKEYDIQTFIISNIGEMDTSTLTIAFDGTTYIQNGIYVGNPNLYYSFTKYDIERYENFYILINFYFTEDVDNDGEPDQSTQIILYKDGTGEFSKVDFSLDKTVSFTVMPW